jgi:HAD superfamily hydrolase (TIGR01509 family)
MALDAVILDLDGTLVDTNGVHIEAWQRVLERFGFRLGADRIFAEVGKGGDKLVPALLGREAAERYGEQMVEAHPAEFGKLAKSRGLQVFPGVRELLAAFHKRGLRTCLATSSGRAHLDVIEEASGLRVRELVDQLVTSDDADESKPAPDLVAAATRKLRVSPAQCVMLGDTPYDAESAKHAGVVCLGLTCGGHEAQTLLRAGARAVYRDAADLLARLDEALHLASPGSAHLTDAALADLMRHALSAAREGMAAGEVPIGCVLAGGDGNVLAAGFNELNRSGNPTAHAEMVAFADAAGKTNPDARDLILVSTLEPCVMCLGAAMESAVDTIVYALRAPADSGTGRVSPPQSPESQMPRIVPDILAAESRKLFEEWLALPDRNPKQVEFVRQLLSLT